MPVKIVDKKVEFFLETRFGNYYICGPFKEIRGLAKENKRIKKVEKNKGQSF